MEEHGIFLLGILFPFRLLGFRALVLAGGSHHAKGKGRKGMEYKVNSH